MGSEAARTALYGILVLLLQVALAPLISVGGIRPDLLVIFTMAVAARRGGYAGLAAGFGAGFAQDLVAINILGVQALVKSSLGYWVGRTLERSQSTLGIGGWTLLIFIVSLVQDCIVLLFLYQGAPTDFLLHMGRTILPSTIYTTIIAFLWSLAPVGERSRQPIHTTNPRARRALR